MKKFILTFCLCLSIILTASANTFPKLKYKNISIREKITYSTSNDSWTKKTERNGEYYIKTKGFGEFYDYIDNNGNFKFTTDCEYEFIYKNNLIGYSNKNMKFYYISYTNGILSKKELSKKEVAELFPDYTVIALSEFNPNTFSIKIKKHIGDLKILLINDTDKTYDGYRFSSGNAKYEQYSLRGFLNVTKQGMIQFSGTESSSSNPLYVLLVR